MPARMEDGFIFCDTPPMRNIDRVSVHLDLDGKLFKTKTPLYFHGKYVRLGNETGSKHLVLMNRPKYLLLNICYLPAGRSV